MSAASHVNFTDATRLHSQHSRQRNGNRRRMLDPSMCERIYTDDEREFMVAMDQYKSENNRRFPTWSEALGVLRDLGYEKQPRVIPMEGWLSP